MENQEPKTKYHYYLERLTKLNWKKDRPLIHYWEALPQTARTKTMRNFLWKLGLYPHTTEEELEELWQKLKKEIVIFVGEDF